MPGSPPAPPSVRAAALLLLAYGVLVVANAILLQTAGGWRDLPEHPRALLRLAGTGLLAWGLHGGRRWAWWTALGLGGLWTALAGVAAVLFAVSDARLLLPYPRLAAAFVALSMLLLGAALALLLSPSARAYFRRGAGP